MAFTFEELATWWPGKSYPVAQTKLLITQEDGRTSYAGGLINAYAPASNDFSGQYSQQFNDRILNLPSPSGGTYNQNFDMSAYTSIDLTNFVFAKIAANKFELRLTFLRWGNTQAIIPMTKAARAKVYTGWGATIGHGAGLALYAVSINAAEETPG